MTEEDLAAAQEIINQFLGGDCNDDDEASNYNDDEDVPNYMPLKIDGQSSFRHVAKEGDVVIQFLHPHADTMTRVPEKVYQPVRILFTQERDHCTWFVVDHAPEETSLTWREFQQLWRSVAGYTMHPTYEWQLDPPMAFDLHTHWPP